MNYFETPDADGNYYLGPQKNFLLDQKAINHIMEGDCINVNNKLVIKGGLHSYDAWVKLKNSRSGLVHGRFFDPHIHEDWYYARELQNEVILLKIPKDYYQSKAAKKTKNAETKYISGYLWKTLFPEHMSLNAIIAVINEALHNIHTEESDDNIKFGYALINDRFKAMKIQISLRENKIMSAFPSWAQPLTGNTGKPFSHIDTIGFFLAESTKFFDDRHAIYEPPNTIFSTKIDVNVAKQVTPSFILKRSKLKILTTRGEAINKRRSQLIEIAKTLDQNEVDKMKIYMNDWALSKDTFFYLCNVYKFLQKEIENNQISKNIYSLYQNLQECVCILAELDSINKTSDVLDFIENYLKKRFLHVGGLELWEHKRLHNLFMQIVLTHHNVDSVSRYINALAWSPNRIAAYTDFNLNPYLNLPEGIIGLDGEIDISLLEKHFYEFSSQNMAINYLVFANEKKRIEIAKYIIKNNFGKHVQVLIRDSLSYSTGLDFVSFSYNFHKLVDLVLDNKKSPPSNEVIKLLMEDYYRCHQYQYYRVILDNKGFLSMDIDYSRTSNPSVKKQIKSKYLRLFITGSVNQFMDDIVSISSIFKDEDLKSRALAKKEKITTSVYPIPKSIPSYIVVYPDGKNSFSASDFKEFEKKKDNK